jgi:hypothetical protein
MSFSTFNTDASAEMYEGMLVRVSDVTVLAIQDANGQWTVGNSTTPAAMGLLVDDIMADPTGATMGACFSHVQGPLHFSFEEWKIEPRNAGDMMLGAGCP